jgi:Spy/CpxP family protein refolding chaperone
VRLSKIVMSLIALMFAVSLPALAQTIVTGPGPGRNFMFFSTGGGPAMPPPIIPPIMMGLQVAHLTADQQSQMSRIMQANHSQIAPLIEQLHSIHEQIANKLLAPGTVTASDLAPLEDQAAQLDAQIQQEALNASLQIRSILTPDQVARMAQFHQKMGALEAQMRSLSSEETPEATPEPTP